MGGDCRHHHRDCDLSLYGVLGLCSDGRRDARADRADQDPRRQRAAPLRAQSDVIGVGLVIAGQAWLFHSLHIAIYMACVLLTAHLFVIFYEEPTLRKQFGEEYERYRASVLRWIPKLRR